MSTPALLAIDLGNTDLKFGWFQNDVEFFGRGWDPLEALMQSRSVDQAIVSNVNAEEQLLRVQTLVPSVLSLRDVKQIPIINGYETPNTLGQDRLCNAVAVKHLADGNPALCIDAGTCLKFDFVDAQGVYQGGSIAPGLQMRFRAMHQFTANLPLIEHWENSHLIGKNTVQSMVSGALEGITNEINETLRRYSKRYENLTIFLTGGDAAHFENAIIYRIFADPNLTLHGLKIILEANV